MGQPPWWQAPLLVFILAFVAFIFMSGTNNISPPKSITFNKETLSKEEITYLTDTVVDYVKEVKRYTVLTEITFNNLEQVEDEKGSKVVRVLGEAKLGKDMLNFNVIIKEDKYFSHELGNIVD